MQWCELFRLNGGMRPIRCNSENSVSERENGSKKKSKESSCACKISQCHLLRLYIMHIFSPFTSFSMCSFFLAFLDRALSILVLDCDVWKLAAAVFFLPIPCLFVLSPVP